jgi:predicted Holliday junction resolvase-like endonuclease
MDNTIIIIVLTGLIFFAIGYLIAKRNTHKEIHIERKAAVRESRGITRGSINEEISTLLPNFPGKFSEARHMGKPVDFIVFNGMDDGEINEIRFIEIKTGKSDLNTNERRIRDIILEAEEKGGRLKWCVYRPDEEVEESIQKLEISENTKEMSVRQ